MANHQLHSRPSQATQVAGLPTSPRDGATERLARQKKLAHAIRLALVLKLWERDRIVDAPGTGGADQQHLGSADVLVGARSISDWLLPRQKDRKSARRHICDLWKVLKHEQDTMGFFNPKGKTIICLSKSLWRASFQELTGEEW
jgi:hypothetical protein